MDYKDQYEKDVLRLAEIIENYTSIPSDNIYNFIKGNSVTRLLSSSCNFCENDSQREMLSILFDFKNIFQNLQSYENNKAYIFKSSTDTKDYYANFFHDKIDKERFAVSFLDTKNNLITTKILFTGSLNSSFVDLREIVKESLFLNSNAIIIAHNHPSGDPTPSVEDIKCTNNIFTAMNTCGIRLLDHIIVGNRTFSFADDGLIDHNLPSSTPLPFSGTKSESIKSKISNIQNVPNFTDFSL